MEMPKFKEGFITLWRDGKFIQVPLSDMDRILKEDNSEPKNSTNLPAGE